MLRFEIRPAQKREYPGIIRIVNWYATEALTTGAFTRWELERECDPGYKRLVAVAEDGTILGTGVARVGLGCEVQNCLIQVMVAPGYAAHDIAPMLHAVLERWAVEQGATHLVAIVKNGEQVTRTKRKWTGAMPAASLLPSWTPPATEENRRYAAAR